jgi:hypothetical protein
MLPMPVPLLYIAVNNFQVAQLLLPSGSGRPAPCERGTPPPAHPPPASARPCRLHRQSCCCGCSAGVEGVYKVVHVHLCRCARRRRARIPPPPQPELLLWRRRWRLGGLQSCPRSPTPARASASAACPGVPAAAAASAAKAAAVAEPPALRGSTKLSTFLNPLSTSDNHYVGYCHCSAGAPVFLGQLLMLMIPFFQLFVQERPTQGVCWIPKKHNLFHVKLCMSH